MYFITISVDSKQFFNLFEAIFLYSNSWRCFKEIFTFFFQFDYISCTNNFKSFFKIIKKYLFSSFLKQLRGLGKSISCFITSLIVIFRIFKSIFGLFAAFWVTSNQNYFDSNYLKWQKKTKNWFKNSGYKSFENFFPIFFASESGYYN